MTKQTVSHLRIIRAMLIAIFIVMSIPIVFDAVHTMALMETKGGLYKIRSVIDLQVDKQFDTVGDVDFVAIGKGLETRDKDVYPKGHIPMNWMVGSNAVEVSNIKISALSPAHLESFLYYMGSLHKPRAGWLYDPVNGDIYATKRDPRIKTGVL